MRCHVERGNSIGLMLELTSRRQHLIALLLHLFRVLRSLVPCHLVCPELPATVRAGLENPAIQLHPALIETGPHETHLRTIGARVDVLASDERESLP